MCTCAQTRNIPSSLASTRCGLIRSEKYIPVPQVLSSSPPPSPSLSLSLPNFFWACSVETRGFLVHGFCVQRRCTTSQHAPSTGRSCCLATSMTPTPCGASVASVSSCTCSTTARVRRGGGVGGCGHVMVMSLSCRASDGSCREGRVPPAEPLQRGREGHQEDESSTGEWCVRVWHVGVACRLSCVWVCVAPPALLGFSARRDFLLCTRCPAD